MCRFYDSTRRRARGGPPGLNGGGRPVTSSFATAGAAQRSARRRATARESGWSDETEEGFYDTVAFIDGAEELCVITSLIVHPGFPKSPPGFGHRQGASLLRSSATWCAGLARAAADSWRLQGV